MGYDVPIDIYMSDAPTQRYECSICYSDIVAKKGKLYAINETTGELDTVVMLPCGHYFCTSCILAWGKKDPQANQELATCPCCRRDFRAIDPENASVPGRKKIYFFNYILRAPWKPLVVMSGLGGIVLVLHMLSSYLKR